MGFGNKAASTAVVQSDALQRSTKLGVQEANSSLKMMKVYRTDSSGSKLNTRYRDGYACGQHSKLHKVRAGEQMVLRDSVYVAFA
jgi:hypothetical protein